MPGHSSPSKSSLSKTTDSLAFSEDFSSPVSQLLVLPWLSKLALLLLVLVCMFSLWCISYPAAPAWSPAKSQLWAKGLYCICSKMANFKMAKSKMIKSEMAEAKMAESKIAKPKMVDHKLLGPTFLEGQNCSWVQLFYEKHFLEKNFFGAKFCFGPTFLWIIFFLS